MGAESFEQAWKHITDYFSGDPQGFCLLVNANSLEDYLKIVSCMTADPSKQVIYCHDISYCNNTPDITQAISKAKAGKETVLIGLSQALMLCHPDEVAKRIQNLATSSDFEGHCLVLLESCDSDLRDISSSPKYANRCLRISGEETPLPKIKIDEHPQYSASRTDTYSTVNDLLKYLVQRRVGGGEVTLHCKLPDAIINNSHYTISKAAKGYPRAKEADFNLSKANEEWGSVEQWDSFADLLFKYGTLTSLIDKKWGGEVQMPRSLHTTFNAQGNQAEFERWLWWVVMKLKGSTNSYLGRVLGKTESEGDFLKTLVMELLEIDSGTDGFEEFYSQRKELLKDISCREVTDTFVRAYCDQVGRHGEKSVYYLTDKTDLEKHRFLELLSAYSYSEEEVYKIAVHFSVNLAKYLKEWKFDESNTVVGQGHAPFLDELTKYFNAYRFQKLTNKVLPEFMATVKENALKRPYNYLQARSRIVDQIPDKSEVIPYFFDALGVEYLSFIAEKCKESGVILNISVGRSELPSITSANKEFVDRFPQGVRDVKVLDEIKHDLPRIEYEKCASLPVHLFQELEEIGREFDKIINEVKTTERVAVIISDHGASRLAVIKEQAEKIDLGEKAIHSGRCCAVDEDPKLPNCAYEGGYAVIADYDTLKGGRRAEVEVHGGATLEEVLVPVITLSTVAQLKIELVEDTIIPKKKETLELFSSELLKEPRLRLGDRYIEGERMPDGKHYIFTINDMKRKGTYEVSVYDGKKQLPKTLTFKVERATKEQDLF